MKKFLMGNPSNILRDSYIWNTIGGLLNAGQSALLLIVISRTNPLEDAGIFSIAYAIASLTITLGKYGMRNFQATDVKKKYDYGVYMSSRILTSALMLLLTGYYIVKGIFLLDYSVDKYVVIFMMGMLKMVDGIEDVVHGMFQQKGRLDIGAKSMAIRYILMLAVYGISLYITHNLVASTIVSFLVSLAYFALTTMLVYRELKEPLHISLVDRRVYGLLTECFSLFAGGFLMIYIANAPKYAIDEYMNESVQACFNYIFMPVYAISVLNTFIYQPVLTKLAICFNERNDKRFWKLFIRQFGIIFGLIAAVMLGGGFWGIPVLSLLYNIDLSAYKIPFMILLLGGGILATSGYLSVVVTIMRKQNWLMIGYVSAAIIALATARPLVLSMGVMGAALLYTNIVLGRMIIFGVIFVVFYRNEKVRER